MSYFNEIYNDPELNARAKQVLVYLHDRANIFSDNFAYFVFHL